MESPKTGRYLQEFIQNDLQEKMVFLGGPRQVGKTTLAIQLLTNGSKQHPAYLNWDFPKSKQSLMQGDLPSGEPLVVLDEIHKYKHWRNLVKGLYDHYGDQQKILVTGSARLDYYRKGGDSLQGRYHYHRLHPFSLSEFDPQLNRASTELMLRFGGFPQPLFKQSQVYWQRWQKERVTRVVQEDLRDLEQVKEISQLELLAMALPHRVGSPLSLEALRKDIGTSHESIRRWVGIFENLYFVYRISPYGVSKVKAVKKEQKLYFWDWSQVSNSNNSGPRFENMVASHLLKYCHFLEDTQGEDIELRYLRDVDGREIDFVVLKNKTPLFAVECKSGERDISQHIEYFSARTPIPVYYQVHLGKRHHISKLHEKSVKILPFELLVSELGLV